MNEQQLDQQTVMDRMEIQDLLVRYCTSIDNRDYDLLDTCFTEDAHLDYSVMDGPAGDYATVRAWLEASLVHLEAMQHSITNTVYEIRGDQATTRTQFRNPNVIRLKDGGLRVFTVGGYYDDVLVRTDTGWKISCRVEVLTYFDGERPSRESLSAAK